MPQRVALICLLLIAWPAFGQTRYVTDDVPITLRTGPTLQNRIVRNLSAGVRVEVLETDEESGYSQVRVASDGTEGWVLTRYLLSQPVARDRLAAAERNLETARGRVTDLEQQVTTLSTELDDTRAALESATSENAGISDELRNIRQVSSNAIALRDENEELRQRLATADQRINRLAMENTALVSDRRETWVIVGAGVLFAGIVLGLILPSLRRKRRSSW